MLFSIALVVAGCTLLFLGGDALLKGAIAMGRRWGWSDAAIGLVLVSFGTSAPELFVSAGSALQGHGDLAAGNVVGSNTVNVALVLGLGALIYPLTVDHHLRTLQIPVMLIISLVALLFLMDGHMARVEGLLLFVLLMASLYVQYRVDPGTHVDEHNIANDSRGKNSLLAIVGVLVLVAGAEMLILGGIGLSTRLGVPEATVALTVTALGTSLPEIAATLIAVTRRHGDLAVGNVVGSNIMNLGLVLAVATILTPFDSSGITLFSLVSMLLFAVAAALVAYRPGHYPRWSGFILLAGYAVYLVLLLGT